jgi:hypothetical protein
MDNFYHSHGKQVVYVLRECGLKSKINTYNIGNIGKEGSDIGEMSWKEIDTGLYTALKNATSKNPPVIKFSFGPQFVDPDIYHWTDEKITEDIKNSYKILYKRNLKRLLSIASKFNEKDFAIVKAASNEGVKNLDLEILNDLGKELNDDEFSVLYDHFLLVGAKDDINSAYSLYCNERKL